jgi:glycine hydroxymethyltransferase
VTTLGMKEPEMVEIADAIVELLQNTKPAADEKGVGSSRTKAEIDPQVLSAIQKRIAALLRAYPLYPELVID